jgi:hypothetical protein
MLHQSKEQGGKEVTQVTHFTVTDPRTFDANPYEVAERAVAQLEALVTILRRMLPPAELMARNAEMTRRMDLGGTPDGDRWVEEPQGRQWADLAEKLEALETRLRAMKTAAGYDPKHPPKMVQS